MVHLATVRSDKEVNAPVVEGLERMGVDVQDDTANTTVYGSSYAGQVSPMAAGKEAMLVVNGMLIVGVPRTSLVMRCRRMRCLLRWHID